jgi:hypothetical protein
VLRAITENPKPAQAAIARLLMQYFGYLRRNPNDAPEATLDFGGYNFRLNRLNSFNGNFIAAEMVKAFLSSSEYRRRFGPEDRSADVSLATPDASRPRQPGVWNSSDRLNIGKD